MLIFYSKKYTLAMSSKFKEAYSELKNAKDLGAMIVKKENDLLNQRVNLYDSRRKRIGCIIGESGTILTTLVEEEMNIDEVIYRLRDLICRNNNITDMATGEHVGKAKDYTENLT